MLLPSCVRWASKKAGGSSKNGRKSPGKRLGLKCGDGESCVVLPNDSSVTPFGVCRKHHPCISHYSKPLLWRCIGLQIDSVLTHSNTHHVSCEQNKLKLCVNFEAAV